MLNILYVFQILKVFIIYIGNISQLLEYVDLFVVCGIILLVYGDPLIVYILYSDGISAIYGVYCIFKMCDSLKECRQIYGSNFWGNATGHKECHIFLFFNH